VARVDEKGRRGAAIGRQRGPNSFAGALDWREGDVLLVVYRHLTGPGRVAGRGLAGK
jgi:hypothetical protein